MTFVGNWVTRGPAMTRPKWSDSTGDLKLKQENFVPPAGWEWDGEWKVSPELSLLYNKDAGLKTYVEDVYELQTRVPASSWSMSVVAWTNAVSLSATVSLVCLSSLGHCPCDSVR